MSGTVQLPRKRVPTLLSTFRRENPKVDMTKGVREPENIDDPPISSGDEDEDQPFSPEQPHVDSSDEDAGNIQRTVFKRKINPNTAVALDITNSRSSTITEKDSAAVAGSSSELRPKRHIGAKKRTKDDVEDTDSEDDLLASKKAKADSEVLAGELGAHMIPENLRFARPTQQPRYGYGKKPQSSTPRATLKMKRHTSDFASPTKEPKFKENKYLPIASSPVAKLKLSRPFEPKSRESPRLSDLSSSEGTSDPPRAIDYRKKKQKPEQRAGKTRKGIMADFSPEPVTEKPQFKMPAAYNNYAPSAELVDLDVRVDDSLSKLRRQLAPGMALCPMCDEQVDEKLLKEFSNGERMRLALQVKFCRLHKKTSAQKAWEEKGYPTIDWASLDARIEGHHDFLKSIIAGTGSHFGDLLEQNIRTGQARTLLTTKDYLTPGYYGLRGMSVMTDAVTDHFSNLLRKRAPVDTRISGRGHTVFVQSVLVPELAVKLIQEDLSLGEDQARDVMEESRAVGEILNDERRHSQSRAPKPLPDESHEEELGHAKDENDDGTDGTVSVKLDIQQAADSMSDLSSPPSYSQGLFTAKAQSQKADHSDSDDSIKSLGHMKAKETQTSVKKQDVTIFPSRASPRNSTIENPELVTLEVDDSDDLSSLASL